MKKVIVPPSPSGLGNPVKTHKKIPSQGPLSVQEETDDVVFSRNAQELLRRPSFSETLDKARHSHRGWLRKLASNGRRWNRRFFVVHGHYLSYFKNESTEDNKNLMGAVNLWRVESVTLDKNIIVITLAPDVMVNNNSLISFVVPKNTMANRVLLEAKDAMEANHWVTTMKVTPFEEPSPRTASGRPKTDEDETEDVDDNRSQASAKTAVEDAFRVKSIHVEITADRVCDFVDVSGLTETTRLRIGEIDSPGKDATVTVEVESPSQTETRKASARFVPGSDATGLLKIPFKEGGQVQISWEQDDEASVEELIRLAMAEDNPSALVLPLGGGLFIVTLFIIYNVLEFRFSISVTVAAILSGSAVAMLYAPIPLASRSSSAFSPTRYVFTNVAFLSSRRLTTVDGLHRSNTNVVIQQAMAKKKESVLGKEDVSILEEEKPKLIQLRKRLASAKTSDFVDSAMKDGRWDRLQVEWKVDESTHTIREIQDRICDKYIDRDFRLVRFLRARNLHIERAEKLARSSLIWRMAVRPDFFLDEYTPPSWIVEYGGAPMFVKSLTEPDHGTAVRLEKWWLRDKQNGLAMVFRSGAFDWRRLNKKMGDATSLMKVGFWALEMGRKDLDYLHQTSNGAIPSYITAVVDLEGFSLTQQIPLTELIPLARRFFGVLATSYPELLKRVIVVNTPFLFNGLWQAVRPFIPEEVQDKIQIHGRCDMNKHLKPYFTEDQIPAFLGGKLTGEDSSDIFCRNRLPPAGPYFPDAGAELLRLKQ